MATIVSRNIIKFFIANNTKNLHLITSSEEITTLTLTNNS